MNEQLPLKIIPKLSYAPTNFVVHAGVRGIIEHFVRALAAPSFWIGVVYGAPRTGKTHLAIKCAELAAKAGHYPRLVEGAALERWLTERFASLELKGDEVIIIDDADAYLRLQGDGTSGPWVDLVERLRVVGGALLILTGTEIDALPCDEHTQSRLRAGFRAAVTAPAEDELHGIVVQMARQRGVALSTRKVNFLVRRLGRTIPDIERFFERATHLASIIGKSFQLPVLSDAV